MVAFIVVIICVLLVLFISFVSIYNNIVQKKECVNQAKADIEVYLVKRYDIIMNSFEVAKGYMQHEKEVFTKLSAIRAGMSIEELTEQGRLQNLAQKGLLAVVEQYPTLKADSVMINLQNQIEDQNEHYAASKRLYNSNVSIFNQYILVFPNVIVAKVFGVNRAEFFNDETADGKREANINF